LVPEWSGTATPATPKKRSRGTPRGMAGGAWGEMDRGPAKISLNRKTLRAPVRAPMGVRLRAATPNHDVAEGGARLWIRLGNQGIYPDMASGFAEIVAETLPVVLVFVAVDAEILPVGAVRGVVPGIPVLVVHR
jgi:hypothetical protein